MTRRNIQGRKVYVKINKGKAVPATIVRSGLLNEKHHPFNVEVKLQSGEKKIINRIEIGEIIFLIPKNKISRFWKDTIKLNPKVPMIVGNPPYACPDTSSVFCARTLAQLKYEVHSVETGALEIEGAERIPSESKPELNNSYTVYKIGEKEIELPEEPNRY